MTGQDDDAEVLVPLGQLRRDLDAVAVAEADVHDHEVRAQRVRHLQGLGRGAGVPHRFEIGFAFESQGEQLRERAVVVRDQNSGR